MAKTLIVSISGIRGIFGDGLDPETLVRYAGAYATWCRRRAATAGRSSVVVVGRDARVTGRLCSSIVSSTLQSGGIDVIDAGLATTPTVEMAVLETNAAGGIMISASHNPEEWNALKLLNEKGEFLSAEEGEQVLELADAGGGETVAFDRIGSYVKRDFLQHHVQRIIDLEYIDPRRIRSRNFKVVVDAVNSVGGFAIPHLLEQLGLHRDRIVCINCEPNGRFAHPAEPLPENLSELKEMVVEAEADLGLAVDPDADRLALVAEDGQYVSEELTQVIAADFMWRFRTGPFATNLSSSRAIDDVAQRYGQEVFRSAVGEINVVKKMQTAGAILGGEGNGGLIVPELHYGRDALAATAFVLQHLANEEHSLSFLRGELPTYFMSKKKTPIGDGDPDAILTVLASKYSDHNIDLTDGLKISFSDGWVHLRKSNTEPILRIYAENRSREGADALAARFGDELQEARWRSERTEEYRRQANRTEPGE